MIVSRLCLAMASFWVLGDLVGAQKGDESGSSPSPEGTGGTNLQIPGADGIGVFDSDWKIPEQVLLGQRVEFGYFIPPDAKNTMIDKKTSLLLCQTRAQGNELVDSSNSWSIVQFMKAGCSPTKCETSPIFIATSAVPSYEPFNAKFISNGARPENTTGYYFFCFGGQSGPTGFYCQSYSPFFDIEGVNDRTNGLTSNTIRADPRVTVSSSSPPKPLIPELAIAITKSISYLNYEGGPPLPKQTEAATATSFSSMTTVTVVPSATGSATDVTSAQPSGPSGVGGSGLATGAIVGIALGGFVGLLLLALLVVFCCRRSRKRRGMAASGPGRSSPEQVMLTHSSGENNSRDILAEKDTTVHTLIHPNSNDSHFSMHDQNPNDSSLRQTLIPNNENTAAAGGAFIARGRSDTHGSDHDHEHEATAFRDTPAEHEESLQRHTTVTNFETSPSAPYTGNAASAPRRNPTSASVTSNAVSALSRNISVSTTNSNVPPSPASQYSDFPDSVHAHHHTISGSGLRNISEENINRNSGVSIDRREGEARYGDTRHLPQVFTGRTTPSAAPFLSEPGMSAEEVARLEEEERRIDAAIAAADEARARERERGGSGMGMR